MLSANVNKVIDNNASAPTAVAEAKARLNALDATIATLTEMYGAQIDAVEYDSEKAYTGVSTANKDAVDAVSTKAATTFATSALQDMKMLPMHLEELLCYSSMQKLPLNRKN